MYMTMEQARQEVKARLPEYLRSKGIDPRRPFRCLNPEHQDNSPSMSYDSKRNKIHCFSCQNADYDTFDLIGIDYGLQSFPEQFKKACEMYNIQIEDGGAHHMEKGTSPKGRTIPNAAEAAREQRKENDVEAYYEKCSAALNQTDYFQKRGISPETVSRFTIGYDAHYKAYWGECQAVVFFTSPSSYEGRNIDPGAEKKHRYSYSRGSKHPFNLDALEQSRPVFVTEGIFDALSITEAGGNAIATTGVDLVKNFIKAVRERKEAGQEIPPIVAAYDNDDAGSGATEQTLSLLKSLHVFAIDGRDILISGCKDANESLLANREAFISNVKEMEQNVLVMATAQQDQERQDYIAETSAAGYLDSMRAEIAETDILSPTGFPQLDEELGGGLYAGLYVIGGISAVGKTSFVLQLADQVAAAGTDVLIFSLEMSKLELISKSVSRLTFQRSQFVNRGTELAQSARDIMTGKRYATYKKESRAAIDKGFQEYAEKAGQHIFITESVGNMTVLPVPEKPGPNIRDIVEKHIRVTGRKPVIIIDYLQILAPIDMRASDKQNTDRAVLALKQLSREYRLCIIGISSFNRDNYTQPVNTASFKESGAIEYGADVLFGIQLKGMDYKDGETDKKRLERLRELNNKIHQDKKLGLPIHVQVKILKQRFAPPSAVFFDFWTRYSCYVECIGDPVNDDDIPDFNWNAESGSGEVEGMI